MCSSIHSDTAPGVLTLPQPTFGILSWPLYWSGVISAGEWPEAFSPTSFDPSHRMQKASAPMPFMVGSTTVMVMALAIAASDRVAALGHHAQTSGRGEMLRGGDDVGSEDREVSWWRRENRT